MHFKDINIQGFRGINNLQIEDFDLINLFVGKNNACKTTILEALFLVAGISNPELIARINAFRKLIITEEEDFRFIFYNLEDKNKLNIFANFMDNSSRELVIEPGLKDNIEPDKKDYKIKDPEQDNFLKFDTLYKDQSLKELIFKIKIKRSENKKAKDYQTRLYMEKGNLIFKEIKNFIEEITGVFLPPQNFMSLNLSKELEEVIINKKKQEIIEILKIIDFNIEDITFGANRMIYFDIGINRLIPINLAGDGVLRLLSIILALYNAKNGVVFIDEIENGLHFGVMQKLWTILYKTAKKFNVQIFATTHNIETLSHLKVAVDELKEENFSEAVRCFTIRKFDDCNLKAYRYNYNEFKFAIEHNIEMR